MVRPPARRAGLRTCSPGTALLGESITVPGLGPGALQGDVAFVDVLARMGADVDKRSEATTVTGTGRLRGITVNMRDISDTMPTLAAIAPFADGPTRIVDVANTRVKECDRLDACATNLRAMGVQVATGPDWIEIQPGAPRSADIRCFADHRIAMAFSVAGLLTPGMTLDDPGCVKKTFPTFHTVLADVARSFRISGSGGATIPRPATPMNLDAVRPAQALGPSR